jgi:hypothetical protein
MSALEVIGVLALATLEGALVVLPTANTLARLTRLRSPAWAAVLPGSILIGTFAPLWRPSLAPALVLLAAVTTPLLAMVAAVEVRRGRWALVLTSALVLGLALVLRGGPVGQLSASAVTGLGCLSAGVALTRLTPRRWLLVGVVLMCVVDVLLLASGAGQPAAGIMADATARFHGQAFDSATVGPVTIDYPDLVLAAVMGGFLAGQPLQGRRALTLALLAAASGMLLPLIHMVPETPPIALTFVFHATRDRAPVDAATAAIRRRVEGPGARGAPRPPA